MLLDAGADINARDLRFQAIEYLRNRGALLRIEIAGLFGVSLD